MKSPKFIHLLAVRDNMLLQATDTELLHNHTVAVLAFKGVISLELKRRDNDQKVIALKLQMQDMMAVLLQ
jgi:hypothetical protein